jgi:hypothetical protein
MFRACVLHAFADLNEEFHALTHRKPGLVVVLVGDGMRHLRWNRKFCRIPNWKNSGISYLNSECLILVETGPRLALRI